MAARPLFLHKVCRCRESEEDTLARSLDHRKRETLEDALSRLELKRQGIRVPVLVERTTDLVDLKDCKLVNVCSQGSNNTLDTLNSSAEMLPQEEAAKLSATNAPIMRPSGLAKKPISVKSV